MTKIWYQMQTESEYLDLYAARRKLDELDTQLVELLYRRTLVTDRIMAEKRALHVSLTDSKREEEQDLEYRVWAKMLRLDEGFVLSVFRLIRDEAKRRGRPR